MVAVGVCEGKFAEPVLLGCDRADVDGLCVSQPFPQTGCVAYMDEDAPWARSLGVGWLVLGLLVVSEVKFYAVGLQNEVAVIALDDIEPEQAPEPNAAVQGHCSAGSESETPRPRCGRVRAPGGVD